MCYWPPRQLPGERPCEALGETHTGHLGTIRLKDEGQERFSGGPCPSLTGPYLQVDPVRVLGGGHAGVPHQGLGEARWELEASQAEMGHVSPEES